MYGDLAEKLVQELRRLVDLNAVPLYQGELVRAVTRENREICFKSAALREKGDENGEYNCAGMVMELTTLRNKRCLLGYHHQRALILDRQVWAEEEAEFGNLSACEQEYLREYQELVSDYKGVYSDFDLTGSLVPPRELYVEVRVLRDAGEIQTEYGVFNLTKDSVLFVRQADVQRLIQQGLVVAVGK